ncbi:hypothetical protein [Massilia phosphatilytica]
MTIDRTLKLSLTNNRIASWAGRSAVPRTTLAFAPRDTGAIQITYTKAEQPVVAYSSSTCNT